MVICGNTPIVHFIIQHPIEVHLGKFSADIHYLVHYINQITLMSASLINIKIYVLTGSLCLSIMSQIFK